MRPGASGEDALSIPVLEAVEKPENGSKADVDMSGGCPKAISWSIIELCDHPSEGCGDGGSSCTVACWGGKLHPRSPSPRPESVLV